MSLKTRTTRTIVATRDVNVAQICAHLDRLTRSRGQAEIDTTITFTVIESNHGHPIFGQLVCGSVVRCVRSGHFEIRDSTLGGNRETLQIIAATGEVVSGPYKGAATSGRKAGSSSKD